MKRTIVILGMQWGDEGKGKIVHAVAKQTGCNLMTRFNGGPNAGHTVELEDGTVMKYNQLPSGCELRGMRSVIANGSVIDLSKLFGELDDKDIQLTISDGAHLITQAHINADEYAEEQRGKNRIGTIGTGNGPAYASKMMRDGLRVKEYVSAIYSASTLGGIEVCNTEMCLRTAQACESGTMILEGAHGWELDIDHGDYPNVTSSSCGVGGAAIGTGLDPRSFDEVIGVVKAYSTRVGSGEFPNKMNDAERGHLRSNHPETGTVSGRQRRIDWIDIGRVRQACRANGVDSIALTHLDVLKGFYTLKLLDTNGVIEIIGFLGDISRCRKFNDLPLGAKEFVWKIQENIGVPVAMISVGPREDQMIYI